MSFDGNTFDWLYHQFQQDYGDDLVPYLDQEHFTGMGIDPDQAEGLMRWAFLAGVQYNTKKTNPKEGYTR